jgi:hypothetical protein
MGGIGEREWSDHTRAMGALAEGLGIRAVAWVFETDANTVLCWLVEAADHLGAFSRHILHDLDVEQVQMDELFALLSAVKAGEISCSRGLGVPDWNFK